jgi:hypothetical protein
MFDLICFTEKYEDNNEWAVSILPKLMADDPRNMHKF